jgi:hypothetical protein
MKKGLEDSQSDTEQEDVLHGDVKRGRQLQKAAYDRAG